MSTLTFSVIIPAYNAASTLEACLQAVQSQEIRPAQILVVNDSSTDTTAALAARLGAEVVDVRIRDGAMRPRFEGARRARAGIFVFIDSDVVIPPGTFRRLMRHFEDPSLAAVTGRLSRQSRATGFFTRFKNEYMNEIFGRRAGETDFLYGSIFAVRSQDFVYFDPISKPFTDVADSELGFQLALRGRKIILDPDLEVEHLKRHDFASLIRNDFVIPFMFTRLFLAYRGAASRHGHRRFSHAALSQVLACAAAFAGIVLTTASLFLKSAALPVSAAFCWLFFYAVWFRFLGKLFAADPVFAVKAALFKALDAAVMFAGMSTGFLYSAAVPVRRGSTAHENF